MRSFLVACLVASLALVGLNLGYTAGDASVNDSRLMIAHNVYFTLKDNSSEARKKLVDACKKHLTHHDGEVFFAAGVRAKEFTREVNAQDWDVGLHIVFKNKAAHDKYQDSERHQQFIKEGRDNWQKVRVYDSACEK